MKGVCEKCSEEKDLAMYRKEHGGKRYYRPYCVQCWTASRREYQKAYTQRNAEKLTKYHAEHEASRLNYTKPSERVIPSLDQ